MTRSGDIVVFSPEVVYALVRAAARVLDAAIYMTAAFTGLRRGELLALRWRDVDFARSTIRVLGNHSEDVPTTPKSGKVRAVPMAPVASALASLGNRGSLVGDDDLVFVGTAGDYLDGSALRRRYGAALQRASLRQLRSKYLAYIPADRIGADVRWSRSADRLCASRKVKAGSSGDCSAASSGTSTKVIHADCAAEWMLRSVARSPTRRAWAMLSASGSWPAAPSRAGNSSA